MPDEPAIITRAREALKAKDVAYGHGYPQSPLLDNLAASVAELILSHERYRHDAEELVKVLEAPPVDGSQEKARRKVVTLHERPRTDRDRHRTQGYKSHD